MRGARFFGSGLAGGQHLDLQRHSTRSSTITSNLCQSHQFDVFVTAILLNSQIYHSRPSNTAMDKGSSLRGACSCGRNHYLIAVSSNPSESLQVLYDDRADHSTLFNGSVKLVCNGTNRQP